jgi:(Z)-2-((N-methylformamido)methylene)-5-hydroxybutyrolactone dehydrogenase
VSHEQKIGAELRREPKLWIGGQWVDPIDGEMGQSIDPATGTVWAETAFGGPKDIDRAVAAAREAFAGPWRKMLPWERAAILRRFADIYKERAPELAILESRDTGRPIREMTAEFANHHHFYQWFASLADKLDGRSVSVDPAVHAFTSRVPVGVVGAITPWNAPMLTAAWKIAPALAAGCTIVLKPAELTPVTAFELARIGEAAGLPPGVLNVVPGYGETTGAHLVAHEDVDKIGFTGEGATAKEILRTGAHTLKRFSFELGGKSAHILFDDADFDQAINAAVSSSFAVCGQSCALGSRVLVQRALYDRVVAQFEERAAKVRVGMPLDPATHMGPQAHIGQLEKTLAYIEAGHQEGARLVAGGKRITADGLERGYFIQPTVFAEVRNEMKIAREEIFGPVVSLIPFDHEEEAIAIANSTRYALCAGLWTRDVSRAHRVAAQIEAGTVWVNTYRYIRWALPYGGFKASGWGRENGVEALDSYLETRTTVISTTGQFPDAYAS